jgi:poly(hydroxyalkanoate) granule-associated protein
MTTRTKATPPAAKARRSARKAVRSARTAGDMMKEAWGAAVTALGAAEEETARQLRRLLRRNRITAEDAASTIAGLRVRLVRERKNLGRTFDSAVHGALATINVPSRKEVAELTRKVEELSARIEGLRRPARTRGRKSGAART